MCDGVRERALLGYGGRVLVLWEQRLWGLGDVAVFGERVVPHYPLFLLVLSAYTHACG